jgi:hypothetical protein
MPGMGRRQSPQLNMNFAGRSTRWSPIAWEELSGRPIRHSSLAAAKRLYCAAT